MIRIGIVTIKEVLDFIPKPKQAHKFKRKEYFGLMVNMTSQRYKLFKDKGIKCVHCGIQGAYFALERHHDKDTECHFNLYAVREDGEEVMLTRDHIVPKSKEGSNKMSNLQPLCEPCNQKKGNKIYSSSFKSKSCTQKGEL